MEVAAVQSRRLDDVGEFTVGAAAPIFNALQRALDLSSASVSGLGMVPSVLLELVERVKNVRVRAESRTALMRAITQLGTVIQDMVRSVNTSATLYGSDRDGIRVAVGGVARSEEFLSGLRDLLLTILNVGQRIRQLKGGRGFLSIVYAPYNDSVLNAMTTELNDAISRFQAQIQFSVMNSIASIQTMSAEIEAKSIIRSLVELPDAAYTENQHLKMSAPKPPNQRHANGWHDNSADDSDLENWRDDADEDLHRWLTGALLAQSEAHDDGRIYFLTGPPGVGKSVAAFQLCKRLNASRRLGASFFFRKDRPIKSAGQVASVIAAQLLSLQPAFRPALGEGARAYLNQPGRRDTRFAFETLLLRSLAQVSPKRPIILVFDALDECRDHGQVMELLEELVRLVDSLPWLYIFISSRPEPYLMAWLHSPVAERFVHHYSLDNSSQIRGEIRRYLASEVPRISLPYAQYLQEHPDALEPLIDTATVTGAYARIALGLMKQNANNPEQAFKILIPPAGASPEDSLHLHYLRSAFPASSMLTSPETHGKLLALLHLIALLAEPLPHGVLALLGTALCRHTVIQGRLAEPAESLALSEGDIAGIVARSSGVLGVDEKGRVRPEQPSFVEFLCDPARCTDGLYRVDAGVGHAALASVCLAAASTLAQTLDILAGVRSRDTVLVAHARYAVAAWAAHHLPHAALTAGLRADLLALLEGDRVPLLSRLTLKHDPSVRRQYDWEKAYCGDAFGFGDAIAQFCKNHPDDLDTDAFSFADEYVRLACYSDIFVEQRLKYPDEAGRQGITADIISRQILKHTGRTGPYDSSKIDVDRYRLLCEGLTSEIDGDARAKELWHKVSLRLLDASA